MLEEATLIARLFNICCGCKLQLFLVSKCSLCVTLVDMSCKREWCSSSVSFWCIHDSLVEMCCTREWCFSP